MAEITADDLRQEITNLQNQITYHANAYQQAVGALQLATAMLERLEGNEAMSVDQLAELVGGPGSTAVIEGVNGHAV